MVKKMLKAQEKISGQEENSSSCSRKTNLEKVSHISSVFSSISVIIAALSFVSSIYPQVIWWNDNYIKKANTGDVYSQIFLANHYYEIGDYGESIYWYKIASTAEKSNYRYFAYNNLGYLYAKGLGFSENYNEELCRFEKALLLFEKAAEYNKIPSDNIRLLLELYSKEDFPRISNTEYEELLARYDVNNCVESVSFEYCDISHGPTFWKDNKKYVGGQYVVTMDGTGKYLYRVYTYKKDATVRASKEADFNYVDFDEMIVD